VKILFALSFAAAMGFLAPSALAQSAPGAAPDIGALSADLQNSRNSAASIQAQAEEIRRLRALASQENNTPAASPDAPSAFYQGGGGDFTVAIPTGNGLVPVRSKPVAPDVQGAFVTARPIASLESQNADP